MGSYSNRAWQSQKYRDLRERVNGRQVRIKVIRKPKPPKQHQNRLTRDQVVEFEMDYRDGMTIPALASKYGIHRNTARDIISRQELPPRNPRLSPEAVALASTWYHSGLSLAAIGRRLDVAPNTVRSALLAAGVNVRPRPGT